MGRGFWGTLSGERGIGATGAREEGDRQDVGGPERAGWRADGDLPTAHPPSATALTSPGPSQPGPGPGSAELCTHSFTFNLLNDSRRYGSSPSSF